MKNKFYNIFLTSEDNNFGKSIRISKNMLAFLLFFGIVLFFLAIIGILRITSNDSLIARLNMLESINFDLQGKINWKDSTNIIPSFAMPVDGFVTKGINKENNHHGIDIAAVKGSEVKATLDGIVIFSGYDSITGNTIILSHNHNLFSLYGHNDTNLVELRKLVLINSPIAKVGNSGTSEGPHLHFEIWDGEKIIDPRSLIKRYKENDVSVKKSR